MFFVGNTLSFRKLLPHLLLLLLLFLMSFLFHVGNNMQIWFFTNKRNKNTDEGNNNFGIDKSITTTSTITNDNDNNSQWGKYASTCPSCLTFKLFRLPVRCSLSGCLSVSLSIYLYLQLSIRLFYVAEWLPTLTSSPWMGYYAHSHTHTQTHRWKVRQPCMHDLKAHIDLKHQWHR